MYFLYFKSVALTVLYVEQDVNFTWQSHLGLENWKINLKIFQNEKKVLPSRWNGLND